MVDSFQEVNMTLKLTIDGFVQKSQKIHASKFDYSKVVYTNTKTRVCITCPMHGEFWQTPSNHFRYGCNKCAYKLRQLDGRLDTEEFIRQSRKAHGSKYSYQKSIYVSAHEKIIITCPIHGDFLQSAHSHANGRGCALCKQGVNHPRFGKPNACTGYFGTYNDNIFRSLSELFWMLDAEKNGVEFVGLDQPGNRSKWQIAVSNKDGRPSTYCADFFIKNGNKVIDIKPLWRVKQEQHRLNQGRRGYCQRGYVFEIVDCNTIHIDYDLAIKLYQTNKIKLMPNATKRMQKLIKRKGRTRSG
ncbi:MAG: hypothetical protein ACXAC5_03520 [Promethearchaeota archaeon]|jgi:hypothetical protein